MQALFKQIALTSASDWPVLITGESGTGKELLAALDSSTQQSRQSALHSLAPIALSPALFESEMFGHVKGAFTGAVDTVSAYSVESTVGTVMLDEIGDLPLEPRSSCCALTN